MLIHFNFKHTYGRLSEKIVAELIVSDVQRRTAEWCFIYTTVWDIHLRYILNCIHTYRVEYVLTTWYCRDSYISHTWSYRGQRVPLAAWTGINFVVSWDRAVNAWNQCESLHRTAHVLILQLKGWIPYILGLMYVDLNLKTNSNHYGDIVCIQSWFWFEINFSSFSSKWSQWYRSKLGLYLISYVYRN